MEINDIVTLIEAVSEHGLTSFVYEENGAKISMKKEKEKEMVPVLTAPASQPSGFGAEALMAAGAAALQAVPAGMAQGSGFAAAAGNGMAAGNGVFAGNGVLAGNGVFAGNGAIPGGAAGMAAGADAAGAIASDKVVTSPLVGTFYNSPSPDAEPFAKVGDTVKKGQVLGIIEAMKLMNEIESEYDGIVEAVLVNNEEVVEYGQPLFRIR